METRRRVLVQLMLGLGVGEMMWAQQAPPRQMPNTPGIPSPADPLGRGVGPPEPDMNGKMEAQQVRVRNTERQKRLQADTDKLLVLATELKQDVEKTDKNILSVDVIKKADEIERLAKSVKDRMKG